MQAFDNGPAVANASCMRSSSILLLLIVSACGGGVALPTGGDGTSGGTSGNGSSGRTGSSGSTDGNGSDSTDGSNGTGTSAKCTPGNYVFCRCADRSEGTKLCNNDGASFGACSCDKAESPPDCAYPATNNPPGCPPTYSHGYQGQSCPTLNLTCSYPGAGDGRSDGCYSTAMMWCRDDGGGARWTTAQ